MKHFKTYRTEEPTLYEFRGYRFRVDRLDGGDVRMVPLPHQAPEASKLPMLRAARQQFVEEHDHGPD